MSQQLMGTSFSSSGQSSVPGQCFTINGISFPFIDGLLSHSGVGGAFGFGAQLRVAVVHEMMDGPVLSYQSINVAIYYWDIVKQLDLLNYRSISTTAVLACLTGMRVSLHDCVFSMHTSLRARRQLFESAVYQSRFPKLLKPVCAVYQSRFSLPVKVPKLLKPVCFYSLVQRKNLDSCFDW